jgi:cytochrome c biogenesis protein
LTSVNFAVAQIIILSLLAVVGMTVRQLPGFAFRSQSDYLVEMDKLHARYDAAFGTVVVDAMERLQLFHVFSSVWFSVGLVVLIISIVVCTLDRTPRLWRQSSDVRVVQPDPFFDPRLPDRARIAGRLTADGVHDVLRRHRFRVRTAEVDGIAYVYGDRHQYVKLATLLTHLGLILFLVAAAVTAKLGDEQGLVVPDGQTLTVQPIGTPGLLLVKNLGFRAPGFETGHPTDFVTDLAVYRDGEQIAHKQIRVNDPLSVAGYTFHQNGFGPAPDVVLRDANGALLWSGPVPLTDSAGGLPSDTMSVPGRDVGLRLLLDRATDGTGILLVVPYRVVGQASDQTPAVQTLFPMALAAGETKTVDGIDFSVQLRAFTDYTLLIAKKDPGQGVVWFAFLSLISGLAITFYLPRRRVWTRVDAAGEVSLVGRADRYADFEREFGRLLGDLVAKRSAG